MSFYAVVDPQGRPYGPETSERAAVHVRDTVGGEVVPLEARDEEAAVAETRGLLR